MSAARRARRAFANRAVRKQEATEALRESLIESPEALHDAFVALCRELNPTVGVALHATARFLVGIAIRYPMSKAELLDLVGIVYDAGQSAAEIQP